MGSLCNHRNRRLHRLFLVCVSIARLPAKTFCTLATLLSVEHDANGLIDVLAQEEEDVVVSILTMVLQSLPATTVPLNITLNSIQINNNNNKDGTSHHHSTHLMEDTATHSRGILEANNRMSNFNSQTMSIVVVIMSMSHLLDHHQPKNKIVLSTIAGLRMCRRKGDILQKMNTGFMI